MGTLKLRKGQGKNSNHVRDGVFVERVAIVSVKDTSGVDDYDIAFELEVDIGRDFYPHWNVRGKFKRNADGSVADWGGAFLVADALRTILNRDVELTSANRIDGNDLSDMRGKTFYRVSYSKLKKDGTPGYGDYNRAFQPQDEETEAEVKERACDFFLSHYKRTGYPRNYTGDKEGKPSDATDGDDFEFGPLPTSRPLAQKGKGTDDTDVRPPWQRGDTSGDIF